jgi:hypothetical protein
MRLRLVIAAAAFGVGASVSSGAFAQDGGIFAIFGLTSKPQEEIDYRERAPLVVPPGRDLPAPVEYTEADKAAWPRDPDVRRRERDAFLRKNPPRRKSDAQEESDSRFQMIQFVNRQKNVGGAQGAAVDPILPNGQPRRRYLTDPPDDARAPANETAVPAPPAQ